MASQDKNKYNVLLVGVLKLKEKIQKQMFMGRIGIGERESSSWEADLPVVLGEDYFVKLCHI